MYADVTALPKHDGKPYVVPPAPRSPTDVLAALNVKPSKSEIEPAKLVPALDSIVNGKFPKPIFPEPPDIADQLIKTDTVTTLPTFVYIPRCKP
jgi:hypothetical protein